MSFNPCSGGSIALGLNLPIHVIGPLHVSILVLVEVLPWDGSEMGLSIFRHVSILVLVEVLPWEVPSLVNSSLRYMFQSLFWWKYCPGIGEAFFEDPHAWSFNPCSGGSIALGSPVQAMAGRPP